jgi:hypothetical protein
MVKKHSPEVHDRPKMGFVEELEPGLEYKYEAWGPVSRSSWRQNQPNGILVSGQVAEGARLIA